MSGGQVCLKWNSFHSSLTSGFKTLWEEDGLVDVTLASDGRCIQAHKLILSACSPFFREVFKANPCQHPVIILQDTHFSELESLLCFVYKGEVNIEQENLPALLRAAETLQIRGLAGASEQVQNELGSVTTSSEIEELSVDESPPSKRTRDDTWQAPSSRSWQPHYSRTKKRSGSRNSTRNAPVSVEAVLETTLSPDRVPKLEPMDHELEIDSDAVAILSDVAEDQSESDATMFLGPVMDMKISHDSRVSDTGQNNGTDGENEENPTEDDTDEPIYYVEQNLQSLQSNQVFNCLTASKKDNPFPPYPCPFCERAYTSWGFRRRHIKAMHTHSQRLTCKWCLLVMDTHANWKKHVSSAHGLSPADAHNGILILDEANMVLRIPNPPRLDTLVTMIRESAGGKQGLPPKEPSKSPEPDCSKSDREPEESGHKNEQQSLRAIAEAVDYQASRDNIDEPKRMDIKLERPDTPD